MRVISGEFGGRRLESPSGPAIRPTTDRVREAMFNTLFSMNAIDGSEVIDLFAGTGALGIEALSRGAERCTFVDTDPAALRLIEANLSTLGITDRAAVVRSDALTYAKRVDGPVDLVLADPPYAYDGLEDLVEAIDAELLVLESGGPVDLGERWEVAKDRTYGATVVVYARRVTND